MNTIKRPIKCVILGEGLDSIYDKLISINGLSIINTNIKKDGMFGDKDIVFIIAHNIDYVAIKAVLSEVNKHTKYVFPIIISKDIEEGNILFVNPASLNDSDLFDYIFNTIESIAESINKKNLIPLYIEDFRQLFNIGSHLLFTYGEASGNKALVEATNKAIGILPNDLSNIDWVFLFVTGGENDISLYELNDAIALLMNKCNKNTNILLGIKLDKHLGDAAKVQTWLG